MVQRRRIREEESAKMEDIAKEIERLKLAEAEVTKKKRIQLLTKHAVHIAKYVNKLLLTCEEQKILVNFLDCSL